MRCRAIELAELSQLQTQAVARDGNVGVATTERVALLRIAPGRAAVERTPEVDAARVAAGAGQ